MASQETTPKVPRRSKSPIADAFLEMFPGSPVITTAFKFMGWAEEEISAGKDRYPRHRKTIHALFPKLRPGILSTCSEALYRAHCRELIARAVHKQDLVPGTQAECLAVLSEASLKAPLDSTHACAMEVCFRHCFPERHLDWEPTRPAYEGAEREVLETIRRRIGERACR